MWLDIFGSISYILLAIPVVILIYRILMDTLLDIKERKYQIRDKYKHRNKE